MKEDYDLVMKVIKTRGLTGIYSRDDVGRAGNNIKKYDWAKRIFERLKADADFWAAKSDEELYGLIPAESPRALVVSYGHGCPIHGGYYSTMQGSFDDQNRWKCSIGGEYWYPGMKVKNPGTGEEVIIEDTGDGWVAPEGFPNPGERYWFVAAYRLYRFGVLYSTPYQPTEAGKEKPECLMALAYTYALTGERRYAHKALLLLNRLAELYRTLDGVSDKQSRGQGTHIAEISTTEAHYIENAARAYDLVFDAIEDDQELLQFFASKGNADYDGNGETDADDIRYNLQYNLMGSMYELANELALKEAADWQLSYVVNMMQIAAVLNNGAMMQRALEGPRGLREELLNAFFRDGKHFYCSLGYCTVNGASMIFAGEEAYGFCDGEIYKKPLNLFHDPRFPFGSLLSFLREIDCDGDVPPMGDSGWGRGQVFTSGYQFYDEVGLLRLPEKRVEHQQRLFTASNGDVNSKRSHPWLLFHAEDFDPGSVDKKNLLNTSHLFPASQNAILRLGNNRKTRKHIALHVCRGTFSHTHLDKLSLGIKAFGWGLTSDVNYWCDAHLKHGEGGLAHRVGWLRHPASHCLAVADGRNQEVATGILHAYYDLSGLKVMDASAEDAYPGLSLYRRSVMAASVGDDNAYIVDIFRLCGGEKTHDYLFHALSGDDGNNFALEIEGKPARMKRQGSGSLAGPDVAYATKSGYSFIKDIERCEGNGCLKATWKVGDSEGTGLRLWMPSVQEREVLTGRAEGYGIFGRSPFDAYMIMRENVDSGKSSTFAAVIEPFQGSAFIESVDALEITAGREADPVCLRICSSGRTDYVFQALNPAIGVEARINGEQFEFAGGYARISTNDAGNISWCLAGARKLVWKGHNINLEKVSEVRGIVEQIDFSKNSFVIRTTDEAAADNISSGSVMLVNNASIHSAVPSAYMIGDVTRQGNKRVQLSITDPPSFLIASARVKESSPGNNTITIDPGTITRTAKRFLDGKRVRAGQNPEEQDYIITSFADSTLSFREAGAASAFAPGDRAYFYDIGIGDEITIGCSYEGAIAG